MSIEAETVRAENGLPRNQFYWLRFFADLVVKQFDHRASVEFQETEEFYYITITREGDSK